VAQQLLYEMSRMTKEGNDMRAFQNSKAKHSIRLAVIASVLMFQGGVAHATPIPVYVTELSTAAGGTSYLQLPLLNSNDTISSTAENVFVGSINISEKISLNGPLTNFLAFCVDPWNWSAGSALSYFQDTVGQLAVNGSQTTDIVSLLSHQAKIESLYSNFYQDTLGNNAKSAAFQLALWEIVSDNAVGQAASGTDQTIWADGQSVLSSLTSAQYAMGSQRYDLSAYYVNRGVEGIVGQNYIVASAVPEPATCVLMLLGLMGLMLGRQKRRLYRPILTGEPLRHSAN
jgi:hypothetical protein